MSFFDMMQGDNGNVKEVLGIGTFTNYLAIHMIYHCVVVFCLYSKMVLYNTNYSITVPLHQSRSEEKGNLLINNVISKYCLLDYG